MNRLILAALACAAIASGQSGETAADLAARYLPDLIRLDSTNPPGNETRVARYLKQVADREGIPAELLGDDPARLNFVARLRGTGKKRPLLMIAHSDVVPADRSQWSVDPLRSEEHTSELQSLAYLVCRLLLEKKKKNKKRKKKEKKKKKKKKKKK